ncbi:MAG: response regulator [Treponema sp.]|nr:response regulator [Treponema sp.]
MAILPTYDIIIHEEALTGKKFIWGDKIENESDFFSTKKELINESNSRLFNTFSLISFIFLFSFFLISMIPVVQEYTKLADKIHRIIYFFSSIAFFLCICASIFLHKLVRKHPLPFLYIIALILYVTSTFVNLNNPFPIPYIMVPIFRVIFPVLTIDKRWRSNAFNNIIMVLLIFFISYKFKPADVFFTDAILTVIVTCIGTVIGAQHLTNQIRYIETKDEKLNKDLEVEKAKGEAKTSFVAHMSHEIRTPVHSILGLNEIILRETDNPKIREYASNIRTSGDTLLKIINDILDFSKIESGKLEIVPAEYELSSMITDLVNMVSQKARQKQLELIINVDETMPHLLFGDELRIKQCMLNILNNAVKYTEKGSITLSIGYERIDSGQIYLEASVKDTGIGIKPEDLSRMFNEFERVDEIRNRTIEGSGLGLSITQMLLNKMGSKLKVQSTYGEGSTFSFSVKQQVTWWEKIGNFTERYNSIIHSEVAYKESFHAPNAHILVVDDTRMNLVVMEGLLKQTQIKVDSILSAREMLEKVKETHYDVIFIDHRMPGMSGVEALHAMKEMPDSKCKDVPCIALTANVVSGAREYYIKEGFSDYISKPVNSVQLEKMLKYYLPPDKLMVPNDVLDQEKTKQAILKDFRNMEGLNIPTAIQNCGTSDVLMVALREYYDNIKIRANQIEQYWHDNDFKNYTIQVHALKSSSRLIGALELSEKAAYLEKCGDEQNIEEINKKTGELLTLYRSYIQKLSVLDKGQVKKPQIAKDRYNEAIQAIKEFTLSFDFNAIDSIIDMIESYSVPPEEEQRYNEIKRCARGGDRKALMELLNI